MCAGGLRGHWMVNTVLYYGIMYAINIVFGFRLISATTTTVMYYAYVPFSFLPLDYNLYITID